MPRGVVGSTSTDQPFAWAQVPGIAKPGPKMSAAALLANMKLLAQYGLTNKYSRDNTVNPMVTYARIARPKETQDGLLSLANSTYDAVQSLPQNGSLVDKAAGVVTSVGDSILAVPNFLAKIASSAFWIRALLIVGGIALLAIGIVLIVKQLGYEQLLPKGVR